VRETEWTGERKGGERMVSGEWVGEGSGWKLCDTIG